MRFRVLPVIASIVLLVRPVPVRAQAVKISLESVVASGLNLPDYITNAHDGSNRLFIIEQAGIISVMPPGSAARTTFLNISSRVLSGGERGLLGLAFHPQFVTNGRFFVDYTRQPDGATVIAEYHVSASDPNAADLLERVLLVIPQPYENHNGGMVEFGPDGYLYIGMGDGGSGNDPQNRAQNPFELLGKILRIDVDRSTPPPTNPYADGRSGRPEIYAIGLRNPFRFSFDPASGQLYVGDVGQDQREEVDIVNLGGNYGWRVWEGTRCTSLGPAPCNTSGYRFPITEYDHSTNGRCSIIGGYVYRGAMQSFPYGAYLYGDYCSGEIFMFQAGVQSVLLRTTLNITSFGQDEAGEIYVVAQGGSIYRITNPDTASISTRNFSVADLGSSVFSAAGATALTVGYTRIQAPPDGTLPAGLEVVGFRQNGILTAEATVAAMPLLASGRIYAQIDVQPPTSTVKTAIAIANPNSDSVNIDFYFTDESGNDFGQGTAVVQGNHQIAAFLTEPPFSIGKAVFQGSFTFKASLLVSATALRGVFQAGFIPTVLPILDLASPPSGIQTISHFAWGGTSQNGGSMPNWSTDFELVNPSDATITGTMNALNPAGQGIVLPGTGNSTDIRYSIPARSSVRYIAFSGSRFGPFPPAVVQVGSLRITPAAGSAAPSATAIVTYNSFSADRLVSTVVGIPAASAGTAFRMFVETLGSFAAPGSLQPAVAIANTSAGAATVTFSLYATDGTPTGLSGSVSIPANGQDAVFLNQIPGFSQLPSPFQGVLRVTSTSALTVTALRTRYNERGDFLMTSVPAVSEDFVPATSELLFPHFATGGGYEVEFVLFSGRPAATSGTIYFFDQNGNSLSLPLR